MVGKVVVEVVVVVVGEEVGEGGVAALTVPANYITTPLTQYM